VVLSEEVNYSNCLLVLFAAQYPVGKMACVKEIDEIKYISSVSREIYFSFKNPPQFQIPRFQVLEFQQVHLLVKSLQVKQNLTSFFATGKCPMWML